MFPEGQGMLPSMTGCAVTVPACFTLWPSQHTPWHLLRFLLPVMLCPLMLFNYVTINPQGTSCGRPPSCVLSGPVPQEPPPFPCPHPMSFLREENMPIIPINSPQVCRPVNGFS